MPIRKRRNNSDRTVETVLEGQVYESTQPGAVDVLVEEAQEFSGTATLQDPLDPLDQIPQSGVFVSSKATGTKKAEKAEKFYRNGQVKYYLIQGFTGNISDLRPKDLYEFVAHSKDPKDHSDHSDHPDISIREFDSQGIESMHWKIDSQGLVKVWINQRIGTEPSLGCSGKMASSSSNPVLFLMVADNQQSQVKLVQCFTGPVDFAICGADGPQDPEDHIYEEIAFQVQVLYLWSKVDTSENVHTSEKLHTSESSPMRDI